MARARAKTIRFTQIVERSGEPRVHTLWLPPEKDPELKRAQKANRVMTVAPAGAKGKIDVGFVGFDSKRERAQFLVFPQSLKRFEGARVVGIKFDLVAQPDLAPGSALKHVTRTRSRHATGKQIAPNRPPPARAELARSRGEEESSNPAPAAAVVPFEPPRADVKRALSQPSTQHSLARARVRTRRKPKSAAADRALLREVRAAMEDLQRGRSVSAYQRLERAVAEAES